MKSCGLLLVFLIAGFVAHAADQAPPAPTDVLRLPAVVVDERRGAEFNVIYLPDYPGKLWFYAPYARLPSRLMVRMTREYNSATVKSGDEIVRIEGKVVAELEAHEQMRLLTRFDRPIEVEVRSPNSPIVRKAAVSRQNFAENLPSAAKPPAPEPARP